MNNRTMPNPASGKKSRDSGYSRFYHTRSYIGQRSFDYTDEAKLMASCGYSTKQQFREHRRQWDSLKRPVPVIYLQTIGARMEVLELTVEQDREEYEDALNRTLPVSFFTVRLLPSVCRKVPFPETLPEHLALELLRDETDGLKRCIHFPDLKTTYVEGDTVQSVYYIPAMKESNQWITFSPAAEDSEGIMI